MSISVKRAMKLIAENAKNPSFKLIDVRTAAERAVSSIPNSSHIPLADLEQSVSQLTPAATYLVYCRSGVRSAKATALLNAKGFTAINLEGGIIEWEKENSPPGQQKPSGGCELMSISAKEAIELIAHNANNPHFKILDVRAAPNTSIPNSINIPFAQLEQSIAQLSKEDSYLVYCRSGGRGGKATTLLNERGFTAWSLAGGITAWEKEQGIVSNQPDVCEL